MQYAVPSVDEFVDLDTFLDSYLTQLHNDNTRGGATGTGPGVQPSLAAGPMTGVTGMQGQMMNSGLAGGLGSGLGGLMQPMQTSAPNSAMGFDPAVAAQANAGMLGQLQGLGMPNMGAGIAGLTGMQGGLQPNFGAPSMGMDALGGGGGLSGMPGLAGFLALQQQQQQQHLQMSQPSIAAGTSARGATKTTSRGRAGRGGKTTRGKSEPELSTSEHHDSGSESGSEDGGGGDHKPRKKQMTTDEAERRHLALQEKNRRAQRRFRERQKNKLNDLHKQIEELTTRVSSLQNENAALHSRTSILEKVLDMRNEQIQVMQETKESNQYPAGDEELLQLQDVGGQLVQLSPEMIKELSSDQIYKIYQMYVKELSTHLNDPPPALTNGQEGTAPTPSSNGGSGSGDLGPAPASPELEKLVKDLSLMIMRLGVIKPLETRKFIVVSRQYLGSSEAEVIELWKNVMRAIDLSEQQKREVVELKRMFLQKIEPIMEERKHLNVQIQANLPHDTFHTKNALTYIKAHEAVIKLRNNLRAEQHVVLEFAIAVFRGVFRPRQMATLLVKCYPAVPDALGIASALAAELGEPESPATRALAAQLGGYLESGGGQTLGTNYMTLHPSLVNQAGPHQAPPQLTAPPVAGLPPGAPRPATLNSTGQPAGSAGAAPGTGGPSNDQFGHWMARPANPADLMSLAASGTAPIVSLLHQGSGAGAGGAPSGLAPQ